MDQENKSRTTFSINDRCELVDSDGGVLGRVVEIEIELSAETPFKGDGLYGLNPSQRQQQKNQKEPYGEESQQLFDEPTPRDEPAPSREPSAEVLEVWEHYNRLIGKGRRELNPTRRRNIERALKVADLETVLMAITGLSVSPHHNGQNDTGTKYLDIRYALRGNSQRGETPEERIDRMAEVGRTAPATQHTTRDRGVSEGRISSLKADIRACWRSDARSAEPSEEQKQLRDEAIVELYGFGILVKLDENGKPAYEDVA